MLTLFIALIIVVIVALCIAYLSRRYNYIWFSKKISSNKDIRSYGIKDLDKMEDGKGFEEYLAIVLKTIGYRDVYKTVGSRDFGADIVFTDSKGIRNVIQAKRHAINNLVGISAVQEAYTSMKYYKAKKSIVITTSKYTESCETLAGVNYVKLLDRKDMITIIDKLRDDNFSAIQEIIEAEPRAIYESWNEMNAPLKTIKQDKKFMKKLNKLSN